ncbi:soluble lytic murein transglycosylase, putative [Shewanella violacea DSS12]|uniref:Soluble lytic murein transglycosylase, putative n=2 Tax=Shewanella violacea TaxID=60217 RepID=D4ZL23_SHEVD|nr:soluble lytic murein transglycosylase, putative [Shewanella violacea DSS12]
MASSIFNPADASDYTSQQQKYLDARQALKKKQFSTFNRLRKQLDGYPLTVYLDFHSSIDGILTHKGSKAIPEINQFKDSPLFNTARYRYLMKAGSNQRWDDFLMVSPSRPNNTILQCYFYRAKFSAGDKETAFKGAQSLWLYGKSRPQECNSLFQAWQNAGLRTQDKIWSRMFLSFNAGQNGLLTYLAKQITSNKSAANLLLSVYKDPRSLRYTKKYMGRASVNGEIVAAGLNKLARKDLKLAVKLYMTYQKLDRFSDYQGRKLSRYFVKRAIIRQEEQLKSFVDTMLPLLDSDDLVELRLRWAIREADFTQLIAYLPQLSDQKKAKPRWQYWQARVDSIGSTQTSLAPSSDMFYNHSSTTRLEDLSLRRNFYGYAAAGELNSEYQLEHQDSISDKALRNKLFDDKALARVIELLAIDKTIDARTEWVQMLARHKPAMQKEYATFALENKWYDLGVQASIQGKLWNDISLRFPYAAQQAFVKASKKQKVNIDELRAIARRESAFYPYATSGVGARGLMQLMPATAKETARKAGVKYKGTRSLYVNEINIRLGSAYYASLLKQFNNNRVLATAAYNAGPYRVKRWLKNTNGKLDVVSFIEAIPFTETREYVQAVLSYRVIYQIKQGKKPELFSAKELNFKY